MKTAKQKAALRKWAKVLKTTRCKQTAGVLRDNLGYCCLGIAAEKVLGIKPNRDNAAHDFKYGEQTTMLSRDQCRALGVSKSEARDFAELNDYEHLTFKEIALYVEALAN